MANIIEYEILEDGTVSIKTGKIDDAVHVSADELLAEVEKLIGGAVRREKLPEKHKHAHETKKAFTH